MGNGFGFTFTIFSLSGTSIWAKLKDNIANYSSSLITKPNCWRGRGGGIKISFGEEKGD